jgi:EAL domain-containing protein (putative c-di-GMP-specific phosphodiesterase class I)
MGIRTAIDDFGTGYSSLSNLRQFQFHTLKIDRSFVADLGRNPSARSIIRGIIGMSHALGMQVVAEGVEEDHQLDYLREQRCDLIQGYLTGRPVRAAGIEPLLAKDAA